MVEELVKVVMAMAIGLLVIGIYCVFFILSYLFTKKKQNTIEPPSFEESMGEKQK